MSVCYHELIDLLIIRISQEVYRDLTLSDPSAGESGLSFCGVASNRYQVITSIENASEVMRLKRKRDSDVKERKSTKTVEALARTASRQNASVNLVSTLIPKSVPSSRSSKNVGDIAPIQQIGASAKLNERGIKKLPHSKVTTDVFMPPQATSTRSRCSEVSNDFHPNWMVITGVPDSVCGADISEFLNGLKIKEIFGYYHCDKSSCGSAALSNVMDIYVQFESKSGVDAAMLRNGENITAEAHLDVHKTLTGTIGSSRRRLSFAACLDRVSRAEASWAKALSVNLEFSVSHCMNVLESLRAAFPRSLISSSPLDSLKKWSAILPKYKFLTPDEIYSHTDHNKKASQSSRVYRYDYHVTDGLYIDTLNIAGGVGLIGLSELSRYDSEGEDSRIPRYQDECSLTLGPSNAIYYEVAKAILEKLSIVISTALLSSYSTSLVVKSDGFSSVESVLDLANRMSNMYQNILMELKM
jgi:hypothetical protein